MLARLESAQERRQQQRMRRTPGFRPPPGAQGSQRPRRRSRSSRPPRRSPPRARPGSGATSPARGPRRRRGARPRRRPPRRAAPPARRARPSSRSSAPPWTTTASRRSSIRGSTSTSSSSGVGADLGEPEAKLLDEVEREPVAARRLRRTHGSVDLDLVARRDGAAEVDARPVPDDRVAAVVEPVVGELDAVARGASARSPCRRSATRPRRRPSAPARNSGSS